MPCIKGLSAERYDVFLRPILEIKYTALFLPYFTERYLCNEKFFIAWIAHNNKLVIQALKFSVSFLFSNLIC